MSVVNLEMDPQVMNGAPVCGTPLWRLSYEHGRLPPTARVIEVYAGDVADVCEYIGDPKAKPVVEAMELVGVEMDAKKFKPALIKSLIDLAMAKK